MAKKQTKYSKYYHSSVNKHIADKIDSLEDEIKKMRDSAAAIFPFVNGEKVAIMDADSHKFKYFAFFKELSKDVGTGGFFYIKYQIETKTGKKDKSIITMFANEYMIPYNEADTNNKYIPLDLSKTKLIF